MKQFRRLNPAEVEAPRMVERLEREAKRRILRDAQQAAARSGDNTAGPSAAAPIRPQQQVG
jgi:hypothetical protein